ncbi:helix-turn-helix domain-containing protein [Microbispora bryophytorum]|uniref:helix-turn-helix domain-containing protein n=1 Tax=Microbispora bryophytorum TaxID=1460882 RepID=UPI00371C9737
MTSSPIGYKPRQFAELFDVHVNTVYVWIRTGQLTVIKIGRTYRIPRAELSRLKAERVA